MNTLKPDVLHWFGLKRSPFGGFQSEEEFYASSDFRAALRMIAYAVESYEIVALVGDVGAGKTEAVNHAMAALAGTEGMQVSFIRVAHPEKEGMRIGVVVEALLDAFIMDGDPLPRSLQRRVLLLRYHLIQAHQGGRRTCLIVDEAHRLGAPFLKGLKELHESIRFGHHASLFGTVLLGHNKLIEKYQRVARDVWERLDAGNLAMLGEMTPPEVAEYITHRTAAVGAPELLSEEARLAVGRLAHSPLAINQVCWKLLEAAYLQGDKAIGKAQLLAAFDRPALAAMLGLTMAEIAQRTGLGKTSVHDALHGKAGRKSTRAVDDVLEETLREG